MDKFTLIMLGDVTGPSGVEHVSKKLWSVRKTYGADVVIANAENCACGNGIDAAGVDALIMGGCDILTSGNHVFKRTETKQLLEDRPDLIRPCNYPTDAPGGGYTIKNVSGVRVLVMNVLGVYLMEPLDNPFRAVERILRDEAGNYDVSILDVHAEATSEKLAMGFYFDGKIGAVIGTHTHVQTSDERIMPKGTAYITDVGMCGPDGAVLGVAPECIIKKMTTHMPVRFELSSNPAKAQGVVVTFGGDMKAKTITRIEF